jgi:hypothetical protein
LFSTPDSDYLAHSGSVSDNYQHVYIIAVRDGNNSL